jgi:hypothetical protein
MVTIYLCSLYYYVSCNYRYDDIDKSQIIVFFGGLGTGDWGLVRSEKWEVRRGGRCEDGKLKMVIGDWWLVNGEWCAASLKKWTQKKWKEFILESEISMGTPVRNDKKVCWLGRGRCVLFSNPWVHPLERDWHGFQLPVLLLHKFGINPD